MMTKALRISIWASGRMLSGRSRRASRSNRPRLALDLGTMHDAPRGWIERVAPVHGAAIIPQHEIADPPDMLPRKFSPRHMAPQLVQQGFGFGKLEPRKVSVAAAAEIQHAPPGVGMS